MVALRHDTVARLPDLMKRYRDERVLLIYYIKTPHGHSRTPKRLFKELGCAEFAGDDKIRCMYDARVRHADESIAALQTALSQVELAHQTIQIVTADHGELFGDGFPLESETISFQSGTFMGAWDAKDRGHGQTCHWKEINVPLVLVGPNIEPLSWDRPVSTLDIVPTLGKLINLPMVNAMDGKVLPLTTRKGSAKHERRFVSYGFCSDSVIQDSRQLIWWLGECRIRTKSEGTPLTRLSEWWSLESEVRIDSHTELLTAEMAHHEAWVCGLRSK
jgi:arylsulfatase A-like enzyme